jgi:hypothetical protein
MLSSPHLMPIVTCTITYHHVYHIVQDRSPTRAGQAHSSREILLSSDPKQIYECLLVDVAARMPTVCRQSDVWKLLQAHRAIVISRHHP